MLRLPNQQTNKHTYIQNNKNPRMLHICTITFLTGAFNKKNAKTGRCVELFHNGLHSARKMTENNGRKQENELQRT